MPFFSQASFIIRAVDKTAQTFARIKQNVTHLDKRFGKLGKSIKGNLLPIAGAALAGRGLVQTITSFEKLEASLRTITGSAESARDAFKFLQQFAERTPFQLEEVVDSFVKLKALGLKPSEEALYSYANTATAMGKSLNQMIEAVADATTGEFERLKEFGIKTKTHGEHITFTFQGISTTVGKNAKEIERYLQQIGNVQFASAIAEQTGTLNVALSNMKGAFSRLAKAIGDAGITDLLVSITGGIQSLVEGMITAITVIPTTIRNSVQMIEKWGHSITLVFKGIFQALDHFMSNITWRFSAFTEDLKSMIENPLNGVSFARTKEAMRHSVTNGMQEVFNETLAKAHHFQHNMKETLKPIAVPSPVKNISHTPVASAKTAQPTYSSSNIVDSHQQLTQTSKQTTTAIGNDFERLGKKMERDMVGSLSRLDSKFTNFGSMARHMLHDINEILLQHALRNTGITGTGGIANRLFHKAGNTIDGLLGNQKADSISSAFKHMFGGFFANGGAVGANTPIMVGERGPEMFVPRHAGHIVPNHHLMPANGQSVTVNMHIHTPDVQGFRKSQRQVVAEVVRGITKGKINI